MNRDQDHDLLRALAETDSASPPPAGAQITAALLHARQRRQRLHRGLAATILVAASGLVFAIARTPAPVPSADPFAVLELQAELEVLRARIATLEAADTAFRVRVDRAARKGLRADVSCRQFATHYPLRAGTPAAMETR